MRSGFRLWLLTTVSHMALQGPSQGSAWLESR